MDNIKLSKTVGQRINEQLAVQEKKQKDLAKHLGIKDNIVSYFCGGTRIPNTEQIKKIAEFLNVSADYLLGITEHSISLKTKEGETIRSICDYTGLNESFIGDFLFEGLEVKGFLTDFLNSIGNSEDLSNAFDIMLWYLNDYLTAVNKIKSICNDFKNLTFEEFITDTNTLSALSKANDKKDINKFRLEDIFKHIIQIYSGENKITDFTFLKQRGVNYGNNTQEE